MADASSTAAIKIATEAAEHFTDSYYTALQSARHTLASYYVPSSTLPDGKTVPGILWNGNAISDGAEFQSFFEHKMSYTHFEVQSLDCHVLNENAVTDNSGVAGPGANKRDQERNMSLVISVNGHVRLEEKKDGPLRGFAETLVLVPNFGEGKGRWRVQNQNFRYTV